jgi:hypothetical protein
MRGWTQENWMTKCLLPICVCLGGLVLPAGCTRSASAPQSQPPVVQSVQPQEPATPAQLEETPPRQQNAVAEPNETTTAQTGCAPALQTGGIVKAKGPVCSVPARAYERTPRGVTTSAPDDAAQPVENPRIRDVVNESAITETEKAAAGKQKTAEPNEARPVGPNIPAAAEPNAVKPEPTENPKPEIRNPQSPVPPATEPNAVKPAATPNPQSEIPNPKSVGPFLTAYTDLLRNDVHADGAVDYTSLHRRRLKVKQMLMELGELDPNSYAAWPSDEKLAFWINVYNLKMLEIIARNYPIQSSWWLRLTWPPSDIRHIAGIWTDYKFIVMGEEFTLAEVEQRFLHRTFADPRAYLAITCACWSGPPLRRKPYSGDHLAQQLDEQVKAFLTGPQGLRIDRRAMVVHLSAIFKPAWRGKEFLARFGTDKKFKDRDPETRAVLNFLIGYLSRDDAYFLETENYTLEYINFDWRLNDTSRAN